MLWLWIWVALAEPMLTTRDVTGSRIGALQRSEHPADLVLVYASEQYGELGPCGCNDYPMGGMARVDRYLQRLSQRDGDTPALRLYAGGAFLAPNRASDVRVLPGQRHPNDAMAEVLERGAWDAINYTCGDLHEAASWEVPSAAFSTNLTGLGQMVIPTKSILSYFRIERKV